MICESKKIGLSKNLFLGYIKCEITDQLYNIIKKSFSLSTFSFCLYVFSERSCNQYTFWVFNRHILEECTSTRQRDLPPKTLLIAIYLRSVHPPIKEIYLLNFLWPPSPYSKFSFSGLLFYFPTPSFDGFPRGSSKKSIKKSKIHDSNI